MRVVVEVGNSGGSASSSSSAPLDSALMKQFAQIQRQLMGLLESQSEKDEAFMESLKTQQNSLVSALEKLVGNGVGGSSNNDELLSAIKGMKKTATLSMPKELLDRFDSMEAAIANGMRRSRNRTFGSNY